MNTLHLRTALAAALLIWLSLPCSAKTPSGTADNAKANGQSVSKLSVMQIQREVTGSLTYRFVSAAGNGAAPLPLPAAAAPNGLIALTIPPGTANNAALEIDDTDNGLAAQLPVSTSAPVVLNTASFTRMQTVLLSVQVQARGVLTGAVVSLDAASPKYHSEWLLKPSDAGEAQFSNVPLNTPLTVKVSYAADPPFSETQTIPSNPAPSGYHWATITVSWPDAQTVPLPAATPAQPNAPAQTAAPAAPAVPAAPAPTSPIGSLASIFFSLLLLGAIGWGISWSYRTGRLKTFLAGVGISAAAPGSGDAATQPSPFDAPKSRPQPITEGTADPLAGGGMASSAPLPVSTVPRLIATAGTYSGSIFELSAASAEIGRDPACQVALPNDSQVSRRHATLQMQGGPPVLIDNASSNGTFVNGVRIAAQQPHPLQQGDELTIGSTRFRFEG